MNTNFASWISKIMPLMSGITLTVTVSAADVRELAWDDLIPPDWDPYAELEMLLSQNPDGFDEGSDEEARIFEEFTSAMASAPVVGDLDGQQVRLPGYVVPLNFEGSSVSEFLLVPYFGACMHSPPPPANQIVYIKSGTGYAPNGLFDIVWVTGTISTKSHLNEVGDAGYTLDATVIEPYE